MRELNYRHWTTTIRPGEDTRIFPGKVLLELPFGVNAGNAGQWGLRQRELKFPKI